MDALSDFPRVGDLFLGRYRIESMLGSGGFARVYRATQEDLEREVAIKVMRPAVDTKADSTEETLHQIQLVEERFRREAKVISKFRSPHTVVVHDYGRTEGGLLFMTLEFVDGHTIGEVIKRDAPMQPVRVVRILEQVLESLHEAHSFDILHRDIKPQNIMVFDHLDQSDLVKVLDFGIAKVLEVDEEAAAVNELTTDGVLVGTPRYMSPEQIRGDRLTPASDIYSLGLVMYEMLSGAKAVDETTTMRIIARHLDPKPLTLPPGLHLGDGMREIVSKMLEKDPDQRFSTAKDALRALQGWDSEEPVEVESPELQTLDDSAGDVLSTMPMRAQPPPASDDLNAAATMMLEQPSFEEDSREFRNAQSDPSEERYLPTIPNSSLSEEAKQDLDAAFGRPAPRDNTPSGQRQVPQRPTHITGPGPETAADAAYVSTPAAPPVQHQFPAGPTPTGPQTVHEDDDERRVALPLLPIAAVAALVLVVGLAIAVGLSGGDDEVAPSDTDVATSAGGEALAQGKPDDEANETDETDESLAAAAPAEIEVEPIPQARGVEEPAAEDEEIAVDAEEEDSADDDEEESAAPDEAPGEDQPARSDTPDPDGDSTSKAPPSSDRKKTRKPKKRRFFSVE